MAVANEPTAASLTLGPVLFNWPASAWRDFYVRIADEAPVEIVYLGEVICSKRAPLFADHVAEVAERLTRAGKTVVFSTLAEVALRLDRQLIQSVVAEDFLIEANDPSALLALRGRPHHVGPFVNVYNERTAAVLAHNGARSFCLPSEMPAEAIGAMAKAALGLGVSIEVQVFGRLSLALSARCYSARAHGRTKDTCRFVCEADPDGMELKTIDGTPFLTVNGIQTMSFDYLNLASELPTLAAMGVARFRLSPHTGDMVEVATIFRSALDGRIDGDEATARLGALGLPAPMSNGFFHGRAGYRWQGSAAQPQA